MNYTFNVRNRRRVDSNFVLINILEGELTDVFFSTLQVQKEEMRAGTSLPC